jgi:hypothetical protein
MHGMQRQDKKGMYAGSGSGLERQGRRGGAVAVVVAADDAGLVRL